MIKSIIHAGGESTRLREIYDGPKPLAPIGYPEPHSLLWFHMLPLVNSGVISEYLFTLRYLASQLREHIEELKREFGISVRSIVEPKPLGRAGVVRYGIEEGIINTDEMYLMSNPDDLIPVDVKDLLDYTYDAERKGKILIMVMARKAKSPFGIGKVRKIDKIYELKQFEEKPELPLPKGYYAHTGMDLYTAEAMKEFLNIPLGQPTNPEDSIIPRLRKQKKVAVYTVKRWISVNYPADYKPLVKEKTENIIKFLTSAGVAKSGQRV